MFRTTSRVGFGFGRSGHTLVLLATLLGGGLSAQAALAEGASVTHASKKQMTEALNTYREGLEAFDAKNFDLALKLLRQSYEIVASPNSRLVIAHSLVQLGREPEAYRELQATVELARKLALVVVRPDAQVTLGDQEVSHVDWGRPQPVRPGKLKVVIRHEGGGETTQELNLAAGEQTELSTAPPPPPPPAVTEKPEPVVTVVRERDPDTVHKRTLAFATGAIGLAGLGAFAAFTVMDSSINARAGCTGGICSESTLDNATASGTYQAIAFVGLGLGIIGLGTSTYLFATSSGEPSDEKPVAQVAIGPGRVVLHGRF